MSSGKKVSTNFAVFIISFLVFTTIVVFAVMLFLSYENMHNNLIISNKDSTELITMDIVKDCMKLTEGKDFVFTLENDGSDSDDYRYSTLITMFVDSEIYRRNGSIYIVDEDGMIYCRNQLVGDGNNQIQAEKGDNGRYYIIDDAAMGLVRQAADGQMYGSDDSGNGFVMSMRCIRISNTDYYCLVKCAAATSKVTQEYISVIMLPAIIAMLIAISLYVAFVWMSLEPVKEISNVISKVADGDFKARVNPKYTNEDEGVGFTLSSEFSQMGSTVNNMIESLENQEKDRELFISSIAHDIRTPLTSINGFVTAMLDGTIPPSDRDRYLNLIKQETDRIRRLVVSMTEASSLAHLNPELVEAFNTSDMIRDIIDNLESQLKDKDIRIVTSLDPGPNNIAYGDAEQLCRVLVNIISNSIKFTPTGGTIKVSTDGKPREGRIDITIEDSGPGIEEDKRKRIFESFYKGDPSRKVEGFGLGLYICKQILAAHGQTITCSESGELGGARFDFSFAMPPKES
ncbi:Signal transduction histidine kinase [Ruminococcaceae bacterium YRB3002]|nr:Signal transduction histidine kinase [Ruminococcaceae bacterium YRB3002]